MATKRLTIELSTSQYETLQQQARTTGTTISGCIRRLIEDLRTQPRGQENQNYREDHFYKRRGSFNGPDNLAEQHDRYFLISQKGQIIIPKKLRDKYRVALGERVQLVEGPDGILIKPAPENPIEAACGFIKGDFSLTADLLKERQKEKKLESAAYPR